MKNLIKEAARMQKLAGIVIKEGSFQQDIVQLYKLRDTLRGYLVGTEIPIPNSTLKNYLPKDYVSSNKDELAYEFDSYGNLQSIQGSGGEEVKLSKPFDVIKYCCDSDNYSLIAFLGKIMNVWGFEQY